MRLTSRIDYGLRAMLDLALNYGSGPIQNSDISRRQNIPDQYLKQILPNLRRRGLVVSARGPQGGHRLAHPPSETTVAQVIQALEGGMEILELADEGRRMPEGAETGRILDEFWKELSRELEQILKTTTLDDLCRRKRRRDQSFTYHI
jgi:Rrf2 family cysteine metabolism transcriptional repressor